MKRSIIVLSICVFLSHSLIAQLKVASSGNIGIQLGTSTPMSALSLGGTGDTSTKAYILADSCHRGLFVSTTGVSANNQQYGIVGRSAITSSKSTYGVGGYSYLPTFLNSGRSWGVVGYAGNATNGYNYGVMGTHFGSGNGAGIVGTVNGNQDVNVPGVYAGYFVGNVYVTGTLTGNPVVNSDKRYKKNIVRLKTNTALDNILQMQSVEYNLEQIYMKSKGDSAVVERALYDEKSQLFKKKHYGLIAQDLQKLYPDLVYEDDNGFLSINYIGIIPLLIESIKELNSEVEMLKAHNNNLGSSSKVKSSETSVDEIFDDASSSVLYQNNPNPFSESTQIKFYLPSTVQNALLCIYDLQGRQLKQITISERGNGSEFISASEFSAGIYLYGLMADGNEVDVKRMILTK